MSGFKPLITIELEEYNKLLDSLKKIGDPEGSTPYKRAIEELINGMYDTPNNSRGLINTQPVSNPMFGRLANVLHKNGIRLTEVEFGKIVVSLNNT